MTVLYLIRARCPNCSEVTAFVEDRDQPVGMMQDVAISADYCPRCAWPISESGVEWDVCEDAIVERVDPFSVEDGGQR